MQKLVKLLLAATFIVASGSAYATSNKTEYEEKENGGYKVESSSEVTNSNGTDKSATHKVDVDVDDKGNVEKTVEHKTKVDPKGLMNSTTTKSKTKTVNGVVVEQESE